VQRQILGTNVIRQAEYHRMRVIGDLAFEQGSEGRAIIDNYCDILETIDGDECLALVVREMK
jgi:hypothetical protein